jgi:hypothetical protein
MAKGRQFRAITGQRGVMALPRRLEPKLQQGIHFEQAVAKSCNKTAPVEVCDAFDVHDGG